MEKHERFRKLKQGQMPENFSNEFSTLSELIISMVHKNPKNRPDVKTILAIIQEQLELLENSDVNELNNENIYLKFKRDRSNSADLSQVKTYEVSFISEKQVQSCIFVKLIDNKLLILPNKDSIKAKIIYDLSESDLECVIKKESAQISIDHPYLSKCTIIADANTAEEFIEKMKKFF